MEPQGIIIWLVIGAVAGWLAGQIVKGGGFGLVDLVSGGNIWMAAPLRRNCAQ